MVRFYDFEEVNVLPKPMQARIPICIAVNPGTDVDPVTEERILRRVARFADGWQTDAIDPEVFAADGHGFRSTQRNTGAQAK